MEKIILFGVGRELERYENYLKFAEIEPYCYADNDKEKWNKIRNGKRIVPPDELKLLNCGIVISCSYVNEITEQLEKMGLKNKIIDFPLMFKLILHAATSRYLLQAELVKKNSYTNILIDAFDGIGWGGMEVWSYQVGESLAQRGYPITIYGSEWQTKQDQHIEKYIKRFELERDNFGRTIQAVISDMEKKIPFILIDNWTEHVFAAAYILKSKYPDDVHIISFVHNDCDALYEMKKVWGNVFDKIAGVSKKINAELTSRCEISQEKLFYKENFISDFSKWEPAQRAENEPIQIGWGGRLEIQQKRADLLIDLINILNNKNLDYHLNIAGDGSFYNQLGQFISNSNLENKIHMLGALKPVDMQKFWKKQHIYINLSDYEGSSLAMLEAMSCGAVPVVTAVSGTDEFVFEAETGFQVEISNVMQIAERIVSLYRNETMRREVARKGRRLVEEKCNFKDYVDYIEKMIKEYI